jgi:ankyrin repeat protein
LPDRIISMPKDVQKNKDHINSKLRNLMGMDNETIFILNALRVMQCGADPNVKNKGGQTVLHIITSFPNSYVLNETYLPRLLELGADPKIKDKEGRTAFRCLMDSRTISVRTALMLIKHGADPNTQSEDGQTVLHMLASLLKNPELNDICLPKLLEHGVSPKIKDNRGWTAFHYLIESGNLTEENGFVMIQHGADPNLIRSECVSEEIRQGIQHRINVSQQKGSAKGWFSYFKNNLEKLASDKIMSKNLNSINYTIQ